MYSLQNLTRIDPTTYQARSASDPHTLYTLSIKPCGYSCSCPAGVWGRRCKHVRALRFRLIGSRILSNHRPPAGEHCETRAGSCGYPRRWLWLAATELALWDGEAPLSVVCRIGVRQSQLCPGCRRWLENLLGPIEKVKHDLGMAPAA